MNEWLCSSRTVCLSFILSIKAGCSFAEMRRKENGWRGEILSESCRTSKIPRSPAREVWLFQPSSHSRAVKLFIHTESGVREGTIFFPQQCWIQIYDSFSSWGGWALPLLLLWTLHLCLELASGQRVLILAQVFFVCERWRFSRPLLNGRRSLLLSPSFWAVVLLLQGEVVRMPLLLLQWELSLPLYSQSILFLPAGDNVMCLVEVIKVIASRLVGQCH